MDMSRAQAPVDAFQASSLKQDPEMIRHMIAAYERSIAFDQDRCSRMREILARPKAKCLTDAKRQQYLRRLTDSTKALNEANSMLGLLHQRLAQFTVGIAP